MAAGSTTGEDHRRAANGSAHPCSETLRRRPHATRVMTREEPPCERNGSGVPVTGTSPTVTLMLTSAWMRHGRGQSPGEKTGRSCPEPCARPRSPARQERQNRPGPAAPPINPQLLADDREDEVGTRERQEVQLLGALPPDPARSLPPEPIAISDWSTWKSRCPTGRSPVKGSPAPAPRGRAPTR